MAASGLRTSETLALRWENINQTEAKIYVDDPNNLRYSDHLPRNVRLRFKGRAASDTYLIPQLRDRFFVALVEYLTYEYIPGCGHDFVFQDTATGPASGRPMHEMSDTARIQAFKRAVRKAGVPPRHDGRDWTPHSLRHAYGVYLLNYLPVPGGYGLTLKEVQRLMGHKSETTTAHYARDDSAILAAKLEHADAFVYGASPDLAGLPSLIAQRLRQEASKYEIGLLR